MLFNALAHDAISSEQVNDRLYEYCRRGLWTCKAKREGPNPLRTILTQL